MAKKQTVKLDGSDLLPDGITVEQLKEFWEMANKEYLAIRKRMYLLDGADRSELWKTITAKFPKYQVLPETNHVNFIKENLVASIYTVGKSAELLPRSATQIETCSDLNTVLDSIWRAVEVAKYQRKAGERAALFNVGYTQVGWDKTILGGTKGFLYRGDVVLKNIDPMKFMKDPYADAMRHGRFVVVWDDYNLNTLKNKAIYAERLKYLINTLGEDFDSQDSDLMFEATTDRAKDNKAANQYHRLQTYWVRYGEDKLAEIHILNNKYVLYVNKEVQPNVYPFAELYCNEPGNDLIGVSEPAKIFKNYIAYNMLNSIVATHAYKAQRPPRFVNAASGINIRQFAQYGADADKTFIVNGDASMAVHYGKFPDLPPVVDSLAAKLEYDIKDKSGIDATYTGRNTGSVQTTGGMDTLMTQATGRDEVKVLLYEDYTRELTELIMQFYIRYGNKRTYAVKDKTGNSYTNKVINFTTIANDMAFDTALSIQNELPRNKMRLAQAANILLEKQAQYKPNPEIITMEEWLLMQDIPFKDLIMERIKIQRKSNMTEQVTSALFQFAGLVEQGIDPNEALDMVIDSAAQTQQPTGMPTGMPGEQPPLGNTANANSFQDAQASSGQGFTPGPQEFTQ